MVSRPISPRKSATLLEDNGKRHELALKNWVYFGKSRKFGGKWEEEKTFYV